MAVGDLTLAQALAHHQAQLAHALQGIPRWAERDEFAHILLCRLLLIYDLQVAGRLPEGDRWYLHNHLGAPSPTTSGSFFQTFLQPLCHQGLSLPPAERSRAFQHQMGDVPYLGCRLFEALPIEQRSPQLDLPDEAIEQFLGWLVEHPWQRAIGDSSEPVAATGAITPSALAAAWEGLLADPADKSVPTASAHLTTIAEQTVDAHVLAAIAAQTHQTYPSLSALLSALNDDLCHRLVAGVLPPLSILDPACGSGRWLIMALERLQTLYQACWQHAQRSTHAALRDWVRSLQSLDLPPEWIWTRQIVTQNLYGVDVRPAAIAVTQTQLWLRLLSTIPPGQALPLLPNLDFNIVPGNALMGFIRVDEESFDQIVPKRTKAVETQETVLQGNLLQPIAAASYRDTLAEKQIRVEHYRAQTRAMGREGGIPEYAQREFMRDRIVAVNASAQQKLNGLLWETLSRQLGIVVKEPMPTGKIRKRLLTQDDIAALQPFHWGFSFNQVIAQGGFDLIITRPPEGTLRPRTEVFYHLHREIFEQRGVTLAAFRRSRRQILQQTPELAILWSTYAGHLTCLKDYVRRSEEYAQLSGLRRHRSLPVQQLFAHRCAQLIKPNAIAPYVE